jgi:hypothetical protein
MGSSRTPSAECGDVYIQLHAHLSVVTRVSLNQLLHTYLDIITCIAQYTSTPSPSSSFYHSASKTRNSLFLPEREKPWRVNGGVSLILYGDHPWIVNGGVPLIFYGDHTWEIFGEVDLQSLISHDYQTSCAELVVLGLEPGWHQHTRDHRVMRVNTHFRPATTPRRFLMSRTSGLLSVVISCTMSVPPWIGVLSRSARGFLRLGRSPRAHVVKGANRRRVLSG